LTTVKVFKLAENQLHGFCNNTYRLDTPEQRISGLTSNNILSTG